MIKQVFGIMTVGTTILLSAMILADSRKGGVVSESELLADRYRQKQAYLKSITALYENGKLTKKQYEEQLLAFAEVYKLEIINEGGG